MPHDRDGTEIKVGDIVYVPVKVKAIHLTEDYCNVDLQTTQDMPPTRFGTELHLNAKQVVKNCLDPRVAREQIEKLKRDATPSAESLNQPVTI